MRTAERRRRLTLRVTGPLIAVVVGLSGCSGSSAAVGRWGAAEGAPADQPYLVLSDDGTVTGTDGCNRLRTTWKSVSDEKVSFGTVASTLKACPGVDTWLGPMATATVTDAGLVVADDKGKTIGTLPKG